MCVTDVTDVTDRNNYTGNPAGCFSFHDQLRGQENYPKARNKRSLFSILRVNNDGDRAVVEQGYFHVGAEFAGLNGTAQVFGQLAVELFVERDGDFGAGGPGEAGAISLLGA